MLLYRTGPEGFYAAQGDEGPPRILYSDPFETPPGSWELGREVNLAGEGLLPPVVPRKVVGVGRNYHEHAAELGNPMPPEPLLFLKAPTSVIGPAATVMLPPESERVEFEGEIALVIGARLTRASEAAARRGILGVTCACDVTARDLQRKDATFARGKSFDTFCPLGPAILLAAGSNGTGGADLEDLDVVTRVNGEERQRGHTAQMEWGLVEQVVYISRMMTLEPGDVILTGTPSGVGPLAAGDRLEVEVRGVGVLVNKVAARPPDAQGLA
jgi:2-keto-4-pentenoate hydratase/2-oxohepta-3-ene-1,7-dioic acid hydratase in catechol pathway